MDVVVIFNGLGNQMSQYAYYLAKKKVNPNTKVIFDIMSKHNHYGYDLERAFGIEVNKTLLIKVLQIIYVLSRKFRLFLHGKMTDMVTSVYLQAICPHGGRITLAGETLLSTKKQPQPDMMCTLQPLLLALIYHSLL